jgi:16S rRNA (uracil1498-N3)-methyltransferase
MSYRFFHSQSPVEGQFTLTGDQAHHAINVMRYREGDRIVIFDGKGTEHDAQIEQLSKKNLIARLLESRQVDRSLSRSVTIVAALPKGDRQKFLVEKLVELGVARLIPLATSRSVAEVKPKVIDRIEKQIVEASKQCGRNHLMEITPPATVSQLCKVVAKPTSEIAVECDSYSDGLWFEEGTLRLLAHPYGSEALAMVEAEEDQPIAVAVGPEGGFSEPEVEMLLEAGWRAIRLGPTILRIETAAIAAATVFGLGSDRR